MRLLPHLVTQEDVEARKAEALLEEVRKTRVKIVRRNADWTEITPAERLIPRGPARLGLLVDADTDIVWTRAPGTIFVPGSVTLVATHANYTYYVSTAGDVIPLERVQSIPTWSWYVARQTRKELAAR
jgi:hypothetical protein